MAQKNKVKAQPAAEPTDIPVDPPVVHTLATVKTENGLQVIRVLTKGQDVLGMVRESVPDCSTDIAYDKVKILSVRYFQNRQIFTSPLPSSLEEVPTSVIHTLGIAKLPDGKYMPVSMRIEDKKFKVVPLFSSPLALGEAFNVYKSRALSFFLGRKLYVE